MKYFHYRAWKVAGIDSSRAGVDQMNPNYSDYVWQGDVFELLNAQIQLQNKHEKSNYIFDKTNGPLAYQARLAIERLIADSGYAAANRFYESLAGVDLGRHIKAYLRVR